MSSEPPVQNDGLIEALKRRPVVEDPEVQAYRAARDALAAKFGGLIPLAEAFIDGVKIGQQGYEEPVAVVTLIVKNMDQVALMAAPHHKMKVIIFEDRRRR